jgi:hypothetical protein
MAGPELFANQAQTTVSSGGTTAPAAGTSQTWTVSSSSGFPAASSAASPPTFFRVTDLAASSEKMIVTNVSGTTWTVTRGAEGTTPVTHTSGFTVENVVTSAALASFAQSSPDWINVASLGADPTGTTAVDTLVNAVVAGLGSQGGVIYFPTGTYKVSTGLTALLAGTQTVTIKGDGASATILEYYGSGDCVRLYNNQSYVYGSPDGAASYFSGLSDLTIDGTNGTGSPVGLHLGDITFLQVQGVIVQNFTGTSSIGVHFDNTTTWSEEGDHRIAIANCTRGVVLEVTTGYGSFGYSNFDLTFFQTGAQSCLCLVNGAQLYHSFIKLRGDIGGSASALTGNPAVISVVGPGPGGSHASGGNPGIFASHLDVLVEPNDNGGAAPHLMGTFYLDTGSSFGFMNEVYGYCDFSSGTGSLTPINSTALPGNNNNFAFTGIIIGDSSLNPSGLPLWQSWGIGTVLSSLAAGPAYSGFFSLGNADAQLTTLVSGATAISLTTISSTNPGPQRKLLWIQQPSSGTPLAVTWPVNGSPTNASPTVTWPGGAPPVLQDTLSGYDVIELVSYDGATWYGRQVASYGTATGQAVALAPERQRVTLTTPFTSATGTTAQTVTGMSAYLAAGTYRLTGWFPMAPAGVTGSTQVLAFTFGGTASSGWARWRVTGASTETVAAGSAVTTASALSPTMTSTGLVGEFGGQVTVSAAGTLQLTVKSTTSGDEVTVPAGAYLDIEPLA